MLRIPKLGEPADLRLRTGMVDDVKVDKAFKVSPTDGSHRRVRLELLLAEISGGRLTSSRTGWVPNGLHDTPDDQRGHLRGRRADPGSGRVPSRAGATDRFIDDGLRDVG